MSQNGRVLISPLPQRVSRVLGFCDGKARCVASNPGGASWVSTHRRCDKERESRKGKIIRQRLDGFTCAPASRMTEGAGCGAPWSDQSHERRSSAQPGTQIWGEGVKDGRIGVHEFGWIRTRALPCKHDGPAVAGRTNRSVQSPHHGFDLCRVSLTRVTPVEPMRTGDPDVCGRWWMKRHVSGGAVNFSRISLWCVLWFAWGGAPRGAVPTSVPGTRIPPACPRPRPSRW